jgi:hypothetical protein
MIYRAIALSLAIVVGLATILPLATNGVEASSQKYGKKNRKKYKKYSRQWWRAYQKPQRSERAQTKFTAAPDSARKRPQSV